MRLKLFRVFAVVLCLVGAAMPAFAQLKNNFLLKVDPLAALTGEYRLVFEKRLNRRFFLYAAPAYYYRENSMGTEAKVVGLPPALGFFGDFLNYSRWFHASGRESFPDPDNFRERIHGPMLRAGFRFYLGKKAPSGVFLHLAVGYGFLFSNPTKSETTYYLHRPNANAAIGKQWLFGNHRNFAFNIYGGMEACLILDQNNIGDLTKKIQPVVYAGVELGFAFRRKYRHW